MQGPNRMGLGLRPPMPSYGQGPSMQALAQQQLGAFAPPQRPTDLFVGSISAGISDAFLNQLLTVRRVLHARASH
jgi:RNA-binding protein 25